jgi:hypothetical protein
MGQPYSFVPFDHAGNIPKGSITPLRTCGSQSPGAQVPCARLVPSGNTKRPLSEFWWICAKRLHMVFHNMLGSQTQRDTVSASDVQKVGSVLDGSQLEPKLTVCFTILL